MSGITDLKVGDILIHQATGNHFEVVHKGPTFAGISDDFDLTWINVKTHKVQVEQPVTVYRGYIDEIPVTITEDKKQT